MLIAGAIVVTLTVVTIAVAALFLAPRIAESRLVFGTVPDLPKPFGYRMSWLAIRTRDGAKVLQALGLHDAQHANWNTGLGTVYSDEFGGGRIFVSPPVNGWTVVAGRDLPQALGGGFVDKTMPFLLDLGARFIEVQYFAACPSPDCYAWARIIDGKLVRAWGVASEGVVWNVGKVTKEERGLGLKAFEARAKGRRAAVGGDVAMSPREEHVLRLARKWSFDPTRIGEVASEPGLGLIGRAPLAWKPEPMLKAG